MNSLLSKKSPYKRQLVELSVQLEQMYELHLTLLQRIGQRMFLSKMEDDNKLWQLSIKQDRHIRMKNDLKKIMIQIQPESTGNIHQYLNDLEEKYLDTHPIGGRKSKRLSPLARKLFKLISKVHKQKELPVYVMTTLDSHMRWLRELYLIRTNRLWGL